MNQIELGFPQEPEPEPKRFPYGKKPDFDGETYVRPLDQVRLNAQLQRVFDVLKEGRWLTLREISDRTGDPEASISARIRDLRKDKFGAYPVNARRRGEGKRGLWEYSVEVAQ